MMASVHAIIGAAIGSRIEKPQGAFAAGVVSHMIADLFPHRDYDLAVELPLMLTAVGFIAARYGIKSSEVAGAVGAVSPDIENGLKLLGAIDQLNFPTHTDKGWFIGHGKMIESPMSQVVLAGFCLWILESNRRASKSS